MARWAENARVVKVFNTNGVEVMRNRNFSAGRPLMYLAGDDSDAVALISDWVQQLGYEAIAFNSLAESRILEPLTLLWIKSAMKLKNREIALQLMRRG